MNAKATSVALTEAENLVTPFCWEPAQTAPDDAWPLAVAVRINCGCGTRGIAILTGARLDGEWHIQDFPHNYEILEFFRLPKPTIAERPN